MTLASNSLILEPSTSPTFRTTCLSFVSLNDNLFTEIQNTISLFAYQCFPHSLLLIVHHFRRKTSELFVESSNCHLCISDSTAGTIHQNVICLYLRVKNLHHKFFPIPSIVCTMTFSNASPRPGHVLLSALRSST